MELSFVGTRVRGEEEVHGLKDVIQFTRVPLEAGSSPRLASLRLASPHLSPLHVL